jgi:hypothetical protein
VIYVFDVSALIGVFINMPNDYGRAFNALTELVGDGKVCFCDPVLEELDRYARDEPTHVWAKAVAQSRCHKDATYKHKLWAASNATDLVDIDADHSSAEHVLAQAYELIYYAHQEACVVTEDFRTKPTREALAVVCRRLAIPVVPLQQCLTDVGVIAPVPPESVI